MIHEMNLHERPYNLIGSRKKTIELRLYDEKRQKINIDDYIIFTKSDDENARLATKVKGLLRFASFKDLFEEIQMERCGNPCDMSTDEATVRMREYYSEEDEKRFGVLGIKVELVDLEVVLSEKKMQIEAMYEHYFPDGMK